MKNGEPNFLLTAWRNEEEYLLEDLEELGEFESSGFRDVVIGRVSDKKKFLEELNSGTYPSLSRVVSIDKSLKYSKQDFEEMLSESVRPYAERISGGDSFKISLTRRGLRGVINSQELEEKMGSVIWKELEKQGKEPEVDLEDPDKAILIESLGKSFYVGFVSRGNEGKILLARF